ncbi:MAG: hypothetical protein JWP36_8 [Paucimonas sp.]|nr:hypothetical protein [Paucimonas sp.]
MAKFLVEANYARQGYRGLLKEGGSKRRAEIQRLFESLGGKVEAFYYAFGDKDVVIIGELPDNALAEALTLHVNASGSVICKTTALITPEEVDQAVKTTIHYRAPGNGSDTPETAAWDNEGGHLRPEPPSPTA